MKNIDKQKRQYLIIKLLGDPNGEPLGKNDLIEKLGDEVTERTIGRDFDELRALGAKITRTRNTGRHKYFLDNDFRISDTFSAEDLLRLTVLRQALKQFSWGFMDKHIEDLVGRIVSSTMESAVFTNEEVDAAVSFKPQPAQPVDALKWEMILEAVLKRRQLDVEYGDRQGKIASKELYPYHLACLEGEWYLLAGSRENDQPVQYSFASMNRVVPVPGKNHFKKPVNFNPHKLLEVSFGRLVSIGRTKMVRVRITGFMVRYVRNRVFQCNQQVKEFKGGKALEISFPASAEGPVPFGNVASWILSMGPCAEALEPPELIKQVKMEARKPLKLYK